MTIEDVECTVIAWKFLSIFINPILFDHTYCSSSMFTLHGNSFGMASLRTCTGLLELRLSFHLRKEKHDLLDLVVHEHAKTQPFR
jgi:hypothetical protein